MAPTTSPSAESAATIESGSDAAGALVLRLRGRLDSSSTGPVWREAMRLASAQRGDLVVDAEGLDYCDGAGASLLLALERNQAARGGGYELRGLRREFRQLVELFRPSEAEAAPQAPREHFLTRLGRATLGVTADLRALVTFTGELLIWLGRVALRPRQVRFKDAVIAGERAGIGATPIVTLVGLLLGLILAFQSAIPMQRFGAQIFVADLLGISMIRELGPLMAAVLLTARSGSAFAAELGTMKVNEEIDALTTMGLEPVRFLVIPRMIAAVAVVPALTMITSLAALAGGAFVFLSFGFPLVTYFNRVVAAVTVGDLLGGLFKAMAFGVVVAAVGCLRGLQTGQGAGAVGESTTSAVVSGIILIAVADGVFAVVFYVLGI